MFERVDLCRRQWLAFGRHPLGLILRRDARDQHALFRPARDDGPSARFQFHERRLTPVEPQAAVLSRWTVASKTAPRENWLHGRRKANFCGLGRQHDGARRWTRAGRENQYRNPTKSQPPATHSRNQPFTSCSFRQCHAHIATTLSWPIASPRRLAARLDDTVFLVTTHDYITSNRQQSAVYNFGHDVSDNLDAAVAPASVAIAGSRNGQHSSGNHFAMASK